MRWGLALLLLAPATTPVSAHAQGTGDLRCGEICLIAQQLKALHSLSGRPPGDPAIDEDFEKASKLYADCTLRALDVAKLDWKAQASIDAGFQRAFEQCASQRGSALALVDRFLARHYPDLPVAERVVYCDFAIGMQMLVAAIDGAEKQGKTDAMRAYVGSRIDMDDFRYAVSYFGADD